MSYLKKAKEGTRSILTIFLRLKALFLLRLGPCRLHFICSYLEDFSVYKGPIFLDKTLNY